MKRILVAEDDPDVAGLVKALLEAAGHEVQLVDDGEKALTTFRRAGADLVVLDVLLPGRNGFQVAESLRAGEDRADVPIVMLSGVYPATTYRAQARERFGAVEFLDKPLDVATLMAAINDGLRDPRPRYPLPPDDPDRISGVAPETLREKRLVERSARVTRGAAAHGDLRETPFPVLLGRLHEDRVSGAMLLVKDPVKKIVSFRDGLPVFVKSNLLSECLGKVLVRERLITDAQCRDSLRLLQETKRQQGALLVEMGALSAENLTLGLQRQFRTKLYEIFSWASGEYRLSTRTRTPVAASAGATIEQILLEGIRSSFDPERLRRELEPRVDHLLTVVAHGEGRIGDLDLQPADRAVVAMITGARTVREILALAPTGPGSAAQLVYALLCAELVEIHEAPAEATSISLTDPTGRPPRDLDALVDDTLAAELQFHRAEAHLANRRWDDAARALRKADGLCPEQADFLASLGWALFNAQGETAADEALRALGRALEASPHFDRAFLWRGYVCRALGRLDDARRDFQEALSCNPDNAEARRALDALPDVRGALRR